MIRNKTEEIVNNSEPEQGHVFASVYRTITRTYFLSSDRSMLVPNLMVLKGPFLLFPELKKKEAKLQVHLLNRNIK